MDREQTVGRIAYRRYNFSVANLFAMLTLYSLTFNIKSMIKTVTLIHRIRVFKTASFGLRKKIERQKEFSKKSVMTAEIKVMNAIMMLADVKDEYKAISDFIELVDQMANEKAESTYYVEEQIIKTTSPEVLSVFLE